jgi:hypothetical protein
MSRREPRSEDHVMGFSVVWIGFSFGLLALLALPLERLAERSKARWAAQYPPRPRNLSGVRRLALQQALPEPADELLERSTFLFVSSSSWERRVDHRIEDADGVTIGWALQHPRPPRLASNYGRPGPFFDGPGRDRRSRPSQSARNGGDEAGGIEDLALLVNKEEAEHRVREPACHLVEVGGPCRLLDGRGGSLRRASIGVPVGAL